MEFMELQLKHIHIYGIHVHCVHVGHGICACVKREQTYPDWLGRMNHMYMYYGIHVHVYTLHMYVCTCIYIAHIKCD